MRLHDQNRWQGLEHEELSNAGLSFAAPGQPSAWIRAASVHPTARSRNMDSDGFHSMST
jgi:hypothetical protein